MSRQVDIERQNTSVVLEARNLFKSFGGVHATQNVSAHVKRGEIVGLIGPNGSGKTTLLNLLAGFYRPDAGRVMLHGEDVTGYAANQIARRGLIRSWQDPRVVGSLSVRRNIELGGLAAGKSGSEQDKFVAELIDKFGLSDVADKPAAAMPYGKQKVVALARALAARPSVLMLDEPLAGLSLPEQEQMVGYIREFSSGGSVVIVDHAFGVIVKLCERVVVLNSGCKLAEGKPDEIASDKSVAEVYLG